MSRKDWSPGGGPAGVIFRRLNKIAPNIAWAVRWEQDPYFSWDGDGPDPVEQGLVPHDVTVTAQSIVRGQLVEGEDHLGGVYEEPEKPDPMIHGYLLQMIDMALDDLGKHGIPPQIRKEVTAAQAFLKEASEREHEEQRRRYS